MTHTPSTGIPSTPTVAALLDLWERARALAPVARRALLGEWALDALGAASATDCPLGLLQRATLALRQAVFGFDCTAVCECPRCASTLELSFSTAEFSAPLASAAPASGTLRMESPPLEIDWRLPTAHDALAIAAAPDDTAAAGVALAACVCAARGPHGAIAPEDLPAEAVSALAAALAAADPDTARRFVLVCPDCGYEWQRAFDVAEFFWSELETWARRQLREVHVLARAYGWSESTILALSPARRRAYLEMNAG